MMNQTKWDHRFLALAREVSTWSKDPSTQTGAVIVRPDKTAASLGFNGFPMGMDDLHDRLYNRPDKYNRIIHCEMNAVLLAREPVVGYTLYTWPFMSCDRCAAHMIQVGILRFVAMQIPENLKKRWEPSILRGLSYMRETGRTATMYPWHEGGLQDTPEDNETEIRITEEGEDDAS